MKQPSVSVRELLAELNKGVGTRLVTEERLRVSRIIEGLERAVRAKKEAQPKKIRNVNTKGKLYSLEEWEALWCGKLDVALIDTWATEKSFDKRSIATLIEEFRTEMTAKNKHYADFAAAFKVYLNKGYLSKKPEQIRICPSANSNKWGNSTSTRGVSL